MARVMKDSGIEWIGEIPEDWEIHRVSNYFSERRNRNYAMQEQNLLSLSYGKIIQKDINTVGGLLPASFNTYNIVEANDIIIRPTDLQNDWRSLRTGLVTQRGIITAAYINLKPYPGVNSAYFHYLLHAYDIVKVFYNMGNGVRQGLNYSEFARLLVFSPPIGIQQAIVDYLNAKCAEIDALMADVQAQIETLEQYKRSVITEAVTKGLNPNVPMTDSGIPWIGNVPAHWRIYRIADLYEDRNERGNEELPLLSVSINTGVSDKELSDDEQDRVFLRSEDKSKYKRVYPGDITYNMMRAWQGAFGAVRVEGMVSPAYVVAKQKGLAEIDSRFIEALIRSPMGIEEMNRFSYGIMDFRKRLYWPQFRIMKVCLPCIEEQRAIADYIDSKSAEIYSIIDSKRQQLSVLEEYKKSVIFEYVTGKKEVPVA